MIVDGANVVGSRPDGWWRDRPGAARRLHDRLTDAVADGSIAPPVVLVLEGAARRGVEPTTDGPVEVVHAPDSGDDAIVELLRAGPEHTRGTGGADDTGAEDTRDAKITVVTADRGLRRRVTELGGEVCGPTQLLRILDH